MTLTVQYNQHIKKNRRILIEVPNIRQIKIMNYCIGNMVSINDNQIKDFLRATIIEDRFHPCVVHSIYNCYDELRGNIMTTFKNDINVNA